VCDTGIDSAFYARHPTEKLSHCVDRNGKTVSKRNVPSKYGTNLCRRQPAIPSKCATPHGMLMDLQGASVQSLYREHPVRHSDEMVAKLGAGLFMHGGNPVYYTAKGTQQDMINAMHAVLRSNPDDLAGHHVVLKITKEAWSGTRYMRVDRLPLVSHALATRASLAAGADPIMAIFRESMRSNATTWDNQNGWLLNLAGTMRMEQVSRGADRLHPSSTSSPSSASSAGTAHWSCPLRRISFWSRFSKSFTPLAPVPGRTAKLFGASDLNMVHGTRAHPTQAMSSLYERLASVHTSNGFCFCVDWEDCQVRSGSSQQSNPCTLLETIRSMYDAKFRTIQLLTKNDRICTRQLDWPFVGGTMRDGSRSPPRYGAAQVPTTTNPETCNVIDRLPPFQYRYRPVGRIHKHADGKTSLDEGGACHMGRPPRVTSSVKTHLCNKIYSNHTHVVARCFEYAGSTAFEDVVMQREMSAAPDWMVDHMKERRVGCGPQQCNAANSPVWKTEFDTQSLPHGPEVSYGIPFRWSTSRLLASDMRSVLCSAIRSASDASANANTTRPRTHHDGSAECDGLLNLPAWTMRAFLEAYAGANFSSLLSNTTLHQQQGLQKPPASLLEMLLHMQGVQALAPGLGGESILQRLDDGEELWSGPNAPGWVACNQNNKTCYGKISKDEWYNPDTKARACTRAFHDQGRAGVINTTAVGLDVCNLNRMTNDLCQILKAAQGKVFEANCIFVGACAPQLFVYTPGMYSSSNNNFVRSTVSSFYEMFKQSVVRRVQSGSDEDSDFRAFSFTATGGADDGDSDRVCPMDNMEWELKTRNEAMKQSCASVQINSMKKSFMMLRIIVDSIVEFGYIVLNMLMCVFRMMLPLDDKGQIAGELAFWFNKLLVLMVESVKAIADLIFDMIFSTGPLGSHMKSILEGICWFLDTCIQIWNMTGICRLDTPCLFDSLLPSDSMRLLAVCQYIVKPIVIPIIKALYAIIARIIYFFRMPEAILDMLGILVGYISKIRCDSRLQCSMPSSNANRVEFGSLPVATRCWADFNAEVDTSSSFSCTASDTCRVSTSNYGSTLNEFGMLIEDENQVVCDSCPLQPGGLVNQFGCDTFTKQCTCNRFVLPKKTHAFLRSRHQEHIRSIQALIRILETCFKNVSQLSFEPGSPGVCRRYSIGEAKKIFFSIGPKPSPHYHTTPRG
jgi:hypothetical protein